MRNPMLMGIPRYDAEPVTPLVSPEEWTAARGNWLRDRFTGRVATVRSSCSAACWCAAAAAAG